MIAKGSGSAIITDIKKLNQCFDITYPRVQGLQDREVQNKINNLIQQRVNYLIPPGDCTVYASIFGKYQVGLNEQGILSLSLQFYTIRHHAANGLNTQKSITVDLENGKVYQLYQLFRRNSNYRIVLNKMIREQIDAKGLHLTKDFKGITDYEDYYLTGQALVIYFQELEYTIHAEGIPEFVIPYFKIRNLIDPQGPIGRFI